MSSVSVNVNAFGLWQMILRTKKKHVTTEGRTLRDLIGVLNGMTAGRLESEVLGADGRLDCRFKIYVNGRESDNLTTPLTEGDDVVLFGVIDGG